jgi:hypothetical protein
MDSTLYTRAASGNANATFTVTNVGDAPAYLEGCARPITIIVYKATAGRWGEFVTTMRCQDPIAASLVLQPGESYRDGFAWDLPATYRLHVLYGTLPGGAYALHAPGAPFELR